ncbi:Dihydrolipoyllysine-residue acetyltransferase component 5 of pyruvate dehydrogenase [Actinidia chinensis var. chinensis]|uniref:Dihydrolipoamide acetyltransferase component of pyruvate dehydrogenase complex n=1 Tax=Actinidia chinensis var. chinensis TaxID=1590841 RepID=A0A2R6Q183_ACTCC|nr:Dihydrolipoyllysine-residue acetyltransferase component 5 of pyruvate dehydrogenase [Actinidia chinensis var. chinensis]
MAHLFNSTLTSSSPSLRRFSTVSKPSLNPITTTRRKMRIQAKIREIFMPALSSTMTEGKIVSWIRSEGDKLSKGESVVVVESDKADMDVETFYDGYLAVIMVEEGGVASVGSAIALLAETEAEIADAKSKASNSSPISTAPPPKSDPPPALADLAPSPAVATTPAAAVVVASAVHPASEGGRRIVASPYAKKLAKDLSVDLSGVVGSGPMGRVVAKDVEAAAMTVATAATTAPTVGAAKPAPVPGIELGSVVPFTTMQSAVSRNMLESLAVPTFRVGYTINTDALDALYKKIKSKGVTMTALLAKATALALVKHPIVSSSCKDGKSFTYNSSINIAVAVAIDGGLITPVLQDADKVDIYSLSRKWKELVDKARAKQLQPHEYNTGTFTLSNLGMFGVDRFDAILPPGTGAIMAVGASQPTVVATKDGRIGMKSQMQVNVTADHRIIYGADLASFLQTLAKIIEDPKDLTL